MQDKATLYLCSGFVVDQTVSSQVLNLQTVSCFIDCHTYI